MAADTSVDGLQAIEDWFARQGWQPALFQRRSWAAFRAGQSGLIHASTGSGKTLAAWLGPVSVALEQGRAPAGLRVLWITPLRALATDTAGNLQQAVDGLGLDWQVETRTGDISASVRARQRRKLPQALVTTPESLSVLLSYRNVEESFRQLDAVIVDEWHELLSSKRGVQLQLCLAWLRARRPGLPVWGLSATLGNLDEAMQVLLGEGAAPGVSIAGDTHKTLAVRGLIPATLERFPWGGHLGLAQLEGVLEYLEQGDTALLFTNTRSQAELWFESVLKARMDWLTQIGLHHGSIDRKLRKRIEDGLRAGDFRCVICTSSLDLGVDFSPVDRVVQVGSPKGVARLMQRAGRSGHQPGAPSEILCVPSHAFELVEIAAARRAWEAGRVEARRPLRLCLDVLVQHLVTLAAGPGFAAEQALAEAQATHAFAGLTREMFDWCLVFITQGGPVLEHYPQFHRVVEQDGLYRVEDTGIARRHRMAIGTITSDAQMRVKFLSGGYLGTVEESFIARLNPGDVFLFSGRALELIKVRDLVAYVKPASTRRHSVPRWYGGRLPLSSELADTVLEILEEVDQGIYRDPEVEAVRPVLEVQREQSALPGRQHLLIERCRSREGHHLFIYPFAGRLAHEGLAALLAWRLGQLQPATFSLSVNDYGLELLTATEPPELTDAIWRSLLNPDQLLDDVLAALNASELARRQFRDIARISGLVFQGYPGRGKTDRQLQASTSLLYDTLTRYDPDHKLLDQARREVMEDQLDMRRLRAVLERAAEQELIIKSLKHFSPLGFPLWVDRLRSRLSTENWRQRVQRMLVTLERNADRVAKKRR
ncbi:ligase-associated DNA damage response DEXH box helicase [Pseudomonas saudimassiliensis]|uniref:ligase-associated DNA damage response DEXH box helicase n=1 Tax=Pseudomonas saudimassiliensis TaxID=1461581 RepID=UPI0005C91A23|nr:ligase-associated DNA damage response DEXH box helicase [Pseudomonas saudimassiliensis]